MRTTIIVLAVIGALLMFWSWRAEKRAAATDFSYAIPGIAGMVALGCDGLLIMAYAIYRLLFT